MGEVSWLSSSPFFIHSVEIGWRREWMQTPLKIKNRLNFLKFCWMANVTFDLFPRGKNPWFGKRVRSLVLSHFSLELVCFPRSNFIIIHTRLFARLLYARVLFLLCDPFAWFYKRVGFLSRTFVVLACSFPLRRLVSFFDCSLAPQPDHQAVLKCPSTRAALVGS